MTREEELGRAYCDMQVDLFIAECNDDDKPFTRSHLNKLTTKFEKWSGLKITYELNPSISMSLNKRYRFYSVLAGDKASYIATVSVYE